MESDNSIKKTCREIKEILKKIPEHLEIEIGIRCEPIPKPIVELYAKLRLFKKTRKEKGNGNGKEGNKRLHHDDKSTGQRDKA